MIAANLAIVTAIILLFISYISDYNTMLYKQNLNDIGNVNQAAAQISSELYASQDRKVSNIVRYISRRKLNLDEIIAYVDDSNSDSAVAFQLINEDYTGIVIKKDENGEYPSVSYKNSDYSNIMQIANPNADSSKIPVTVEFTDPYTGLRSFGRYAAFTAEHNGEIKSYTLMAVYRSASFIGHINLNSGFDGLSTVLINKDGSYALRNSYYKAENLFRYIYNYNDLTLDEMNVLKEKVLSNDGGSLRYKNSLGEECAFVYCNVPGTDWLCVSSVRISAFHMSNPDLRMTVLLLMLFIGMALIDFLYLFRLNKRLKESVKEANAANEAKTDFLSRMSHDIRTPINVISGMTELALMENGNPPVTTEYLSNIKSSGKFLLGLVNDILDMNKVESGKMELHKRPYSLREFVGYLNAVIRPLCEEKGIDFTIDFGEERETILVDPLRFNQIFFNLLSNSVKFTPCGGHISIFGKGGKLGNGKSAVEFTVRDDGAGMSEEFQKTMFSAFSQEARTSSQNTQGTGLGLAIVKNLVGIMNGTMRVESEIDKGTAFFISMDLEEAPEAQVNIQEAETAAADLGGRRVLLCEDHPLNAKIMIQLLSRKGMSVSHAENGRIGVDMFASSAQNYYDLILMDIRMPVMDGIEAATAIRALPRADAAAVPIIALTANAYDSDVEKCLAAGMNAHLAKPVEVQKLYSMLSSALARRGTAFAEPVRKEEKQ